MNQNFNTPGNSQPQKPTAEQIAVAAYQLYIENGSQDGHDFDDWICAEKLLTAIVTEKSGSADAQPARKAASLAPDLHPAAPREHPLARDERGSPNRKEIRQMSPRRPASRH